MNEWLRFIVEHADKLPFVVAVNGANMRVQLSYQRILEAVIIGAVLAAIGYIAVIPQLEQRITLEVQHLREDFARMERRLDAIEDIQRQQPLRFPDMYQEQPRKRR